MVRKYELVKENTLTIKDIRDITLFRIRALIDFGDVKAGDLGGYVQSEDNLSQDGNAWIYNNARVYDDARVFGNARVYNNVRVYDSARVYDNARIYNDSQVSDNACVYGNAMIIDNASIYEDAHISCNALVADNAQVYGNAHVFEHAYIRDDAEVHDDAKVFGNARVFGFAEIGGNADVKSEDDYAVFKNSWSSKRFFTYTRSNQMWQVGCFYGTSDELVEKAYEDSELSGDCYKQYVDLVNSIYHD